jgi:hypothetical protein
LGQDFLGDGLWPGRDVDFLAALEEDEHVFHFEDTLEVV